MKDHQRDKDKLKTRYRVYRKRASNKGLNFDLSLEEFSDLTSLVCYYCNQLTFEKTYVGLDRIDNSKGYSRDSLVPCCKRCNYMRWTLNQKDFLNHVERIYEHLIHQRHQNT